MERIYQEDSREESLSTDDSRLESNFIIECTVDSDETDSEVPLGIEPYRFEPYASDDDRSNSSESSDSDSSGHTAAIDRDIGRLQNTEWCSCDCCQSMLTVEESICCREQDKVTEKTAKHPDITCITEHPSFDAVCLNEDVLQTAYYAYEQSYGPYQGNDWKRYTGYRQFVRWCYRYLGRKNRVPIPACVVSVIRRKFP